MTLTPTTGTVKDRIGGWIQVYSGAPFWPLDPRPEEIEINDIAWALSMQCRFAGHVKNFYSVAEHSVHVASLLEPHDALWGLLHDATEAYLTDLVQPLKVDMPQYRAIEDRLMECVAERFGLQLPVPESVKRADRQMLFNERDVLLNPAKRQWDMQRPDGPVVLLALPCFQPRVAYNVFMDVFRRLCK